MKKYTELFGFQLKKEMLSAMLWLTTLVFAILLIGGQMIYIRHFRLQNQEDYDQIRIRRTTDISIPLRGMDRADYYTERIRGILELSSNPETDEICGELRALLSQDDEPGITDVMNAVSRLKEEYESLRRYSDYTFRNEYTYSGLKEADFSTIRNYTDNEGISFRDAFSEQYAQMAAMIACIAFSVYFSFLFSAETDSGTVETLRVVRFGRRMIWLVKYLAGLAACWIAIILVTAVACGLVMVYNPGTEAEFLLSLFRSELVYTFPAVFFISAFSAMASVLTKSGFAGLPAALIMVFLSSVTIVTAGGDREQCLFLSPIVMNTMPYYAPLTQEFCRKLLLSRLFWIVLSVLCVFAASCLWDREYSGKRKNDRKVPVRKEKLKSTGREGKAGFGWYNAKIALSAAALISSAAFIIAPLFLNQFSAVTEAGPAILSNAGWAAILLFSRLLSLEYSEDTCDAFMLARMGKLKVTLIRCLPAGMYLIAAESVVYLLAMLKTEGFTANLFMICFSRSLIAFATNTFFWGTLSMCLSAMFRRTWAGLGVTSFIHLLVLSKANGNSALNMYFYKVYYTFPERADSTLILSSIIYLTISVFLTVLAVRLFGNLGERGTALRRKTG